jgi:hypothetical protein
MPASIQPWAHSIGCGIHDDEGDGICTCMDPEPSERLLTLETEILRDPIPVPMIGQPSSGLDIGDGDPGDWGPIELDGREFKDEGDLEAFELYGGSEEERP